MITNNLKKIISSRMTATSGTVQLINIDGTSYSNNTVYVVPYNYTLSSGDGRCYIAVGSGNTAPTASDVSLEDEITGLTNVGTISNNNEYGALWSATITNSTNNEVTISEYGLYVYSGGYKMLTRTVLDNPVTLASGESVDITINLGF